MGRGGPGLRSRIREVREASVHACMGVCDGFLVGLCVCGLCVVGGWGGWEGVMGWGCAPTPAPGSEAHGCMGCVRGVACTHREVS